MPTMTVPSAAMRRLRRKRDADRGKGASLAPEGGVDKKKSSPPPLCSPPAPPENVIICLGIEVRVRTPVRLLSPGRFLVFWLHAIVVGAEEDEDGHIQVIYCDYNHRDSDPSGVVRVLKKDVKNLLVQRAAATGSSDVTSSHSAGASPSQGHSKAPPLRPTVAGKTPSVLKKMKDDMWSDSEDSLDSWEE